MKYVMLLLIAAIFTACGGKNGNSDPDDYEATPSPYAAGEKIYMSSCVACHQQGGQGVEGAFPPLAGSDYLLADTKRAITIAAKGMDGEITVNGVKYNDEMAPQGLSNQEVTDVMNYILNAWGNDGGNVTLEEVNDVLGTE